MAEADAARKDADQYATQVLSGLRSRLEVIAKQIEVLESQVDNGLKFLGNERIPSSAPETHREREMSNS